MQAAIGAQVCLFVVSFDTATATLCGWMESLDACIIAYFSSVCLLVFIIGPAIVVQLHTFLPFMYVCMPLVCLIHCLSVCVLLYQQQDSSSYAHIDMLLVGIRPWHRCKQLDRCDVCMRNWCAINSFYALD